MCEGQAKRQKDGVCCVSARAGNAVSTALLGRIYPIRVPARRESQCLKQQGVGDKMQAVVPMQIGQAKDGMGWLR